MRMSTVLMVLFLLAACGSDPSTPLDSSVGEEISADVATAADAADLVPDSSVDTDVPEIPLVKNVDFQVAGYESAGPAVFLQKIAGAPGELRLAVFARQLGLIGGMAGTLEYDSSVLNFLGGEIVVDLGSSGPYATQGMVGATGNGALSFGVARFCEDKSPWGDPDQCGGDQIADAEQIVLLRFELLEQGATSLRFVPDSGLIRRPDRTRVHPTWIGGTAVVATAPKEVTQ